MFKQIRKFVLQNQGDEHEAQDMFHDAVLRFMIKVRNGEITIENDGCGYVYAIGRNAWIAKKKRDRKISSTDSIEQYDQGDVSEFAFLDDEKRRLMEGMLESIGETCRALLQLTLYKDHSLKEATELMGLSSVEVTKTYHYRCKKKLIEKIKKNKVFLALVR